MSGLPCIGPSAAKGGGVMARGRQPNATQIAEERSITLRSATDELLSWDEREAVLLDYLESATEVQNNPTLAAIVRRLQRGNVIEDRDHIELHEAVRAV